MDAYPISMVLEIELLGQNTSLSLYKGGFGTISVKYMYPHVFEFSACNFLKEGCFV